MAKRMTALRRADWSKVVQGGLVLIGIYASLRWGAEIAYATGFWIGSH